MDRNQPLRPPSPQPRSSESGGSFSSVLTVFASFIAIFSMVSYRFLIELQNALGFVVLFFEFHFVTA